MMRAHLKNKFIVPTVTDEVVCTILSEKIKTKTPFALTRFGDGEIYFLNKNVPIKLREKVCNLWDYTYPSDYPVVDGIITNILHRALKESDLIGLLDRNNIICDKLRYDEKIWSISTDYLSKLGINNFECCDHQVTRGPLLGNILEFKKVLNGNNLTIISPNEQLRHNDLDELLEAEVTIKIIKNDRAKLLHMLPSILDDVVIFGASVMGKDIGCILKNEYGKIAVDFGATLDAWAGIESRPWFKDGNLQNYCMIKAK